MAGIQQTSLCTTLPIKKMKKYLSAVILFLLFSCSVKAQDANPEPKFLVEKNWVGISEQNANFTRSGKIQLKQTLNLSLNADYSVTGIASTTMTLDGVAYYNSTNISGNFTHKSWALYIKEGNTTRADALPNGLKWCKGTGTLTFYINKSKPGYYLLKGTLYDDCGGSSFIGYSDSQ